MARAACCLLLVAAVLTTAAPDPQRAPARTGTAALSSMAALGHHLLAYVQQHTGLGWVTFFARPEPTSPSTPKTSSRFCGV